MTVVKVKTSTGWITLAGGAPADVERQSNKNIPNGYVGLNASSQIVLGGDANLYRAAANYLKTDGHFRTGGELRVAADVVVNETSGKVFFGSALDTNLFRYDAGLLRTTGAIIADQGFVSYDNSGSRWYGIRFGTSQAEAIYRYTTGILETDATFHIVSGQYLALNNSSGAQATFAWGGSREQYRHQIKTAHNGSADSGNIMAFNIWTVADGPDGLGSMQALALDGQGSAFAFNRVMVNNGAAQTAQVWVGQYGGAVPFAGLTFGGDTYLYRAGAKILQTDGTLGWAGQGAGNVAWYSIASGDSNWRFYMDNTGIMHWGPGNAASDAYLQRVFAAGLQTNAWFIINRTATGDPALSTDIGAEANVRFTLSADGRMSWGGGVAVPDVGLYRSAGGQLAMLANGALSAPQSNARLSLRYQGNALEWGHGNPAGYGANLGSETGSGAPSICFLCEHGTNANTYRTRGFTGSIIRGNPGLSRLEIGIVSNPNADNQGVNYMAIFDDPNGKGFSWSGLQLYFDGMAWRRVATGPADSGGSGYRMLIVPN